MVRSSHLRPWPSRRCTTRGWAEVFGRISQQAGTISPPCADNWSIVPDGHPTNEIEPERHVNFRRPEGIGCPRGKAVHRLVLGTPDERFGRYERTPSTPS